MKIGLAIAEFNREVTERLEDGAKKALLDAGLSPTDVVVMHVPGAFELPLAAKLLFAQKSVAGVVALGAVIKGDTKHFDYVCNAAERGCLQVSLEFSKPVGFGVLTTDTFEQAWERCVLDKTNKGFEAANAVLELAKTVL